MEDHIKFRSPVKQLGFAQIEHAMALDSELSHGAYRTFAIYLMYAHQKEICWPGRKRVAADLNQSEATLKRYTQELVRLSYITRKRRMNQSWLTIIEDIDRIPRLQKLAKARLLSRRKDDEEVIDDPSMGSQMTHPWGQERPIEEESIKDNQGKKRGRASPAAQSQPAKPKRKSTSRVSAGSRKKRNVSPAAARLHSLTGYYPPKDWTHDVAKITDLDRWESVIHAWTGLGRNPMNVSAMVEHYNENRMPSVKGAKRAQSTGRSKHHQEATPETRAAFQAHFAKQRRAAGVEEIRAGPSSAE